MSTMTSMAIPWEFCKGRDEQPLGDSRGEPVGVPGNARNRRNLGMFIPLKWWLGGWFLALGVSDVSHVIICCLNHLSVVWTAWYNHKPSYESLPIGSMYGIYANIWGILMVNVTIYGIHGSYGLVLLIFGVQIFPWCCMKLHDSPVPAASGSFGAALVFQPRPFSVQILWIKFIGPLGPKNWPARVSLYMSTVSYIYFVWSKKLR